MILHRNYRNNGGGEQSLGDYQQSPLSALQSLCLYEIGYGGQISRLSETCVEVSTQVMRCHDRTVFEGTVEEMAPLVRAAAIVATLLEDHREEVLAAALARWEQLPDNVRGIPLILCNMAGQLMGQGPAMAALVAAANLTSEEELASLEGLGGVTGMMAAVRLHLEEEGLPFIDAAATVRDARTEGFVCQQLNACTDIALGQRVSYRQALEAGRAAHRCGLPMTDVPALIALSRESGQPIAAVAQLMAA